MTARPTGIDWATVRGQLDRQLDPSTAATGLGAERRAQILRDRAAALAGRSDGGEAATHVEPMAAFTLGDDRYAIALTSLAAVVRNRRLGPVPGATHSIVGTLYERGEIWTIHEPRRLLGIPGTTPSEPGYLLLLRGHRRAVGLRVDGIGGVRRVRLDRLGPPSAPPPGAPALVLGVTADAVAVVDATELRNHPALTEVS